MGVLLNVNETVKEIANIGAGLNNNDTSNKKEATVFVVLDMHPGLMDPTETLGRYLASHLLDFTFRYLTHFNL